MVASKVFFDLQKQKFSLAKGKTKHLAWCGFLTSAVLSGRAVEPCHSILAPIALHNRVLVALNFMIDIEFIQSILIFMASYGIHVYMRHNNELVVRVKVHIPGAAG